MFAYNESLASAKGFFFEVLSEIFVDDDDVILEGELEEASDKSPEVTPE
jgi:hypothetical protein